MLEGILAHRADGFAGNTFPLSLWHDGVAEVGFMRVKMADLQTNIAEWRWAVMLADDESVLCGQTSGE